MLPRIWLILLVASSAISLGCTQENSEPTRVDVSGEVMIDGKPLPKGFIYFKTIAEGVIDSTEIVDGKYAGQVEPGSRRVEIVAYRPVSGGTPGMDASEENYIPTKYNLESELTADVLTTGPNTFQFEVTSK
ncbi:hypothetical protein EC9_10570 [Rosistilla ulvae]|uniref:Carboxypeptidase regulatory-like domain-containing protein n=1 Tax=Rosistilla ulvae TaxID=1930277 RepID=A0A517LW84_9BACT|nr:hypothetical protein [Rosistilla ulvae]QDS86882.1 hypothetical protein EC9_10570 [Rosistilla ulvae]